MSKVSKLGQLVNLVFYIALQLGVAQFIVLGDTALCFVYVTCLLLLPRKQTGIPLLLLISFAVGLLMDMFYQSRGAHAFSSVLMVYGRTFVLQLMLPANSYKKAMRPTIGNLGWKHFSIFALPLISMHHTVLFFLETGHPMLYWVTIRKVLSSTILTYAAVVCTQIVGLLAGRRC